MCETWLRGRACFTHRSGPPRQQADGPGVMRRRARWAFKSQENTRCRSSQASSGCCSLPSSANCTAVYHGMLFGPFLLLLPAREALEKPRARYRANLLLLHNWINCLTCSSFTEMSVQLRPHFIRCVFDKGFVCPGCCTQTGWRIAEEFLFPS